MADLILRGRVIVDVSQMLCDLTGSGRPQLLKPGALHRLVPTEERDLLTQAGTHRIRLMHASGHEVPVTVTVEIKRGRTLVEIEQVHC